MILLPLIRTLPTDDGVFGHILYKDYHWHTLEPELPREGNKGCIPAMIYECTWDETGRFHGYKLNDPKGFSAVEMHIINTEDDTRACIGLGKRRGRLGNKYAILDSGEAFKEFYALLKRQPFILDIMQRFTD